MSLTSTSRAPLRQPAPEQSHQPIPRRHEAEGEDGKGRIRLGNEAIILLAAERIFARHGFKGATMAMIADEAQLPKPNIHYYFGNKQTLYITLLNRILRDWLAPLDDFRPDVCARNAIERYVRQKMSFTFARPEASRLFASEILYGAPLALSLLKTTLRELVDSKAAVIDSWIAQGQLKSLDSRHLLFSIWAMTQTYADFEVQIVAVLGDDAHGPRAQQRATEHVLSCVFRICGLA